MKRVAMEKSKLLRLLTVSALAVLLAYPATAKRWTSSITAFCADSFEEATVSYGPLTQIINRVSDHGFGILLAENETFEVLVVISPQMSFCVIWDTKKSIGDPA